MKNPTRILKISDHVFKISEPQLEFLLYSHFINQESVLKILSLWVFPLLIFECILIAFIGAETFVHYKGHLLFGAIFISWFIGFSYTSWSIRKKRIDGFINELKELGL